MQDGHALADHAGASCVQMCSCIQGGDSTGMHAQPPGALAGALQRHPLAQGAVVRLLEVADLDSPGPAQGVSSMPVSSCHRGHDACTRGVCGGICYPPCLKEEGTHLSDWRVGPVIAGLMRLRRKQEDPVRHLLQAAYWAFACNVMGLKTRLTGFLACWRSFISSSRMLLTDCRMPRLCDASTIFEGQGLSTSPIAPSMW